MSFLIAEISNHHYGCLKKAKRLIATAKECGADAVKGQAFLPSVMSQIGSMSEDFYKKCALQKDDYEELISYGKEIGIDVFFSIISPEFAYLRDKQKYRKVFANQAIHMELAHKLKEHDVPNAIISFPEWTSPKTKFEYAALLCATNYGNDITIAAFDHLCSNVGRDVGISHHGTNMRDLEFIISERYVPIIEKHFYLGDNIYDKGNLYRDCTHSFPPKAFARLAKIYKG